MEWKEEIRKGAGIEGEGGWQVDMLNMEKAILTQQITNERGLILSQEKKMALCETCGSFLVANDATERTHSHMTGKQHVGYGLVRHYLLHYQVTSQPLYSPLFFCFLYNIIMFKVREFVCFFIE